MTHIETHIKYLEEKLDKFLVLKNYTKKHTVTTKKEMQQIINFVQMYMDANSELYDYIDSELNYSRFFWDDYFGDELNKLIKNLKREIVK